MIDPETTIAPPGSPTARSFGCNCDARRNRNGEGAGTTEKGDVIYIISPRCKMHFKKPAP